MWLILLCDTVPSGAKFRYVILPEPSAKLKPDWSSHFTLLFTLTGHFLICSSCWNDTNLSKACLNETYPHITVGPSVCLIVLQWSQVIPTFPANTKMKITAVYQIAVLKNEAYFTHMLTGRLRYTGWGAHCGTEICSANRSNHLVYYKGSKFHLLTYMHFLITIHQPGILKHSPVLPMRSSMAACSSFSSFSCWRHLKPSSELNSFALLLTHTHVITE